MIKAEERGLLKEIKKEVLNYLSKRNLGVYNQWNSYQVVPLQEALQKMPQEKYYDSLFSYKLGLSFLSSLFNKQNEYIDLFVHLYHKTTIDKNTLMDNINDLTDGYWKKDMGKFLSAITQNIEGQKNIILNLSNSSLGLNSKNINQLYVIFKDLEKKEKIEFWVKFFNKRKRALTSNKGGSEIHKFLTENFNKEDIKNYFLDLSPYINDLFDNTVNINIFSPTEKYQVVFPIDFKNIEKALKIPGLNVKKITFEFPKAMRLLSSIMGYKFETIHNNSEKKMHFILYSNEKIEQDLFKQTIQDYLILVKNCDGKFLDKEEDFAKWYMKNKLDKKLIEKDIKTKIIKI